MSFIETILGSLLSAFFGLIRFFDNLKPRLCDDPGTARYRSLQRACVLATLLPFVLLGLGFVAANLSDAFGLVLLNPQAFEGLCSTLANGLLGLLVLSATVASYDFWRLWRFAHGDDNFV